MLEKFKEIAYDDELPLIEICLTELELPFVSSSFFNLPFISIININNSKKRNKILINKESENA